MKLLRTTLPLTSVLWLALVQVPAGAQDENPIESDAVVRWEQLSEEEKTLIQQRFERWKTLTADRKEELVDRHRSLGKAKKNVLTTLPENESRRLKRMRRGEQDRALKKHLREYFHEKRRRVLEQAEPGVGPQGKVPFSRIRKSAMNYAAERLLQLEEDGHLQPGEAEELLAMPPWELRQSLRGIQKRHFLTHPPEAYQRLPEEERSRLESLDPEEFVRAVQRLKSKNGSQDLPPMMKDLMRGRDRPLARPLPRGKLERVLGTDALKPLEGLDRVERMQAVRELLLKKAREALKQRGEDSGVLENLRQQPLGAEQRHLLRIIEGKKVRSTGPPRRTPGSDGSPSRSRQRRAKRAFGK